MIRPKVQPPKSDKIIRVYVNPTLKQEFSEIAGSLNYPESELGRIILERFVQQHKAARRQNGK